MSESLRRALEAELAASPEDVATHAAYADLLDEMGDVRGEFVQVQLALEDASLDDAQRERLARREAELLRDHRDRILGRLGPHLAGEGVAYELTRGWLESVEASHLTLPFARALRDAPQARLLRRLAVEAAYDDRTELEPDDGVPRDETDAAALWPLAGSAALANVQYFRFGSEADGVPLGYFSPRTDVVIPLVRSMPNLEGLSLSCRANCLTHLFAMQSLRRLRSLRLHHNEQVHRLDVLACNPAFANLERLCLHPHALNDFGEDDRREGFDREEGYLPLRVVEPFFDSPNLPRLRHLQLRLSSMGDEGCRVLVASEMLGRLTWLDLRHGRIGDEGARALLACPDVRRLEWLDLRGNALSEGMTAALDASGVPGDYGGQRPPGSDHYLYEGDVE